MEVIHTKPLHKAGNGRRVFLTLHERLVKSKGDKEIPYYFVGRGEDVPTHEEKRPDAVVVVAFLDAVTGVPADSCPAGSFPQVETPRKLIVTSEFRIPIGVCELGFPAGIIDPSDYEGGASIEDAAYRAATRELKEETGYDFVPLHSSPANLYSSAGLTNESVIFVFGNATGEPSTEGNEELEEIEVMAVSHEELIALMDAPKPEWAWSKTSWPLFWGFEMMGHFPIFAPES